MISALFWNIRDVRTKKAIHRLKSLIKLNNSQFVAIFEPFIDKKKIKGYKKFLGFQNCLSNEIGQIWCFWSTNFQATAISNKDQQITLHLKDGTGVGNEGAVYAKCTALERQELWDDLTDISNQVQSGWCIGGDFNVILEPSEKIGGKIHRAYKIFDFAACMNRCGLENAGFVGSNYTWCNNRRPGKRIWKRLDRIIINGNWLQRFNNVTVRHLSRTGSDHRPLLLKCYDSNNNAIKHFRFRYFWVEQPGFMDLVGQDWQIEVKGNPMWILQQKLKRLGKRLSKWSREDIGDIFQKVEEWEATLQRWNMLMQLIRMNSLEQS
ncbi:uncharacterized protein LOC132631415 [Lycium barbarum]|uniref:uncharacterized protein LOC132631415 n=1 Tax=Lycium barbarum TaxID=112863 RepID=UPI00293F2D8D|nr:uncharacterized protein LOC132631415 [Lycium barbarum]